MESSYKKLSKLRDETEFELKTIKKWLKSYNKNHKLDLYASRMEALFKLYEIE